MALAYLLTVLSFLFPGYPSMRLSTLSLSIVMAISVGLLALLRTSANDDTPDSSPPARPVSDKPVAAAETPKNPPAIPAEERPFWDSAQQFLDAYARRDAAAIGGLFTEDAEFVDEFGERTQGRAAIQSCARQQMP